MKNASIRKIAPELTVDIEVADTHTYQLGNGVVSHNTTSKLFGLTEGAHLPAMLHYLRWVQFRNDDPLIGEYQDKGYPTRELRTYDDTTIVGFPTSPEIVALARTMGLEDKLVMAADATPEEQFQWLRLLEKYWIRGDLEEDTGNQVSYTLKYKPHLVDLDQFRDMLAKNLPSIKCVSVMPQDDATSYEYQPEDPVTKERYEQIVNHILAISAGAEMEESLDLVHIDCSTGACPISFDKDGI